MAERTQKTNARPRKLQGKPGSARLEQRRQLCSDFALAKGNLEKTQEVGCQSKAHRDDNMSWHRIIDCAQLGAASLGRSPGLGWKLTAFPAPPQV